MPGEGGQWVDDGWMTNRQMTKPARVGVDRTDAMRWREERKLAGWKNRKGADAQYQYESETATTTTTGQNGQAYAGRKD